MYARQPTKLIKWFMFSYICSVIKVHKRSTLHFTLQMYAFHSIPVITFVYLVYLEATVFIQIVAVKFGFSKKATFSCSQHRSLIMAAAAVGGGGGNECSICMDEYNQHAKQPKALNCGHTFSAFRASLMHAIEFVCCGL